jgi:SAM-dependent methyltransferase
VEPNPKQIVIAGYDRCGPLYNAARAHDSSPELERLVEVLPPQATALDIGCGGGFPVTAALARKASVTGVDISCVQIEEARKRLPSVRFIVGDIMSQNFEPSSFDAVVSFYTLFHIPRDEHNTLFERVAYWLRPGGYLLASIANSDHPGYTEADFFGVTMYWSHFEPEYYAATLNRLGFEVLKSGVLSHGYRNAPGLPPERHPFVFARTPQTAR